MHFLGLDIGHSGIKMVITTKDDNTRTELPIIPSVAKNIGSEKFAKIYNNEWITRLHGSIWSIGDDAKTHGLPQDINISNWHRQDDYWALTQAVFERLKQKYHITPSALLAGLPSEATEYERSNTKDRMEQLVPSAKIKVVPQPVGAFLSALDEHYYIDSNDRKVITIDIGRYNTNVMVTIGGKPINELLISTRGIVYAANILSNIIDEDISNLPYESLEKILITGKFSNFKMKRNYSKFAIYALNEFKQQVLLPLIEKIKFSLSNKVDDIILTGGGSNLITIDDNICNIIKIKNSLFSNANGFAIGACKIY